MSTFNGPPTLTQGFSITQWYADSIAADLTNDVIFESFMNCISLNINQFARLNKTELMNYFLNLPKEICAEVRSQLSYEFISHHKFDENTHILRNRTAINPIVSDIYDLIQFNTADSNSVHNANLGQVYIIEAPEITQENENNISINDNYDMMDTQFLLNNIKSILQENQKSIFDKVNSQSKHIKELIEEKKGLKQEIVKINSKLDQLQTQMSNKNCANDNDIIPINSNSSLSNNSQNSNEQNNRQQPIASYATRVSNTSNINFNTQQQKRPNTNQNNNNLTNKTPRINANSRPSTNSTNNNIRQNTTTQKTLRNFNSQNPNAPNTNIPKETPWRTAGPKIRKFNKSNQYLKSVGTNKSNSELLVVDKPFSVYIGRLDNSISTDRISAFLKSIFKSKISDLKEVKQNHTWFKSYWFTISYLEKSLIDQKELWPSGCVVDRYRRPKSAPATSLTSNATNTTNTTSNNTNASNEMHHEQSIVNNDSNATNSN